MKLKKILIFFVLVFFLISINVYSSSIFDVENITLPDNVVRNGYFYILGYNYNAKDIFLCYYIGNRSFSSFYVGEDGGIYNEFGDKLDGHMRFITRVPSTGEWSNIGHYPDGVTWSLGTREPLFSNRNVYLNNELYIFGKEHYSNLGVLGGLSSSVFFSSLIKPLLKLMPFILTFIVLFLTFFKMWNFLKGVF